MKNSIRRQMQVWLMTPLLVLLVVSAVCSYVLSIYLSREAYDKVLLSSADSVVSRLRPDGDGISIDALPMDAMRLLTHNNQDQFLYEVFSKDGKLLTKNHQLIHPPPAINSQGDLPVVRYHLVSDTVYRVATLRGQVPGSKIGEVIIEAAETLNARKEYRRKLLLAIVIPQMILLSLAVVAVWVSIEKGLKPLRHINEAVRRRAPSDLSPIRGDNAPAEVTAFLTTLNGLFVRIADDLERQQRFAANAAHQLRTPLAGLKTYLQVMQKTCDKDSEFDKMLSQMLDGVDRIIRTVQQLLTLSRAEQGTALDQFGIVNLNSIVEEAACEVVPASLKSNIELEFNTPETPTKIRGDSVSLKELTTNLLENAIKYNQSGGHVSVHITNGKDVQLIVEDDGRGIPEHERSKVFERFYRVSTVSSLEVQGSGLGLSIVAEIARLHGATVTIDTGKEARGTKITVSFPLPQEQVQN